MAMTPDEHREHAAPSPDAFRIPASAHSPAGPSGSAGSSGSAVTGNSGGAWSPESERQRISEQRISARRIADDHLRRVLEGRDFLVFDGAMGTQLQARGLKAGSLPELMCLTDPDEITEIHASYVAAGSQAITTNTFGANAAKLGDTASVERIFSAAIECARRSGARYVAADIGPTGSLLQPMGTLSFDDAYNLFAEQARAADAAGADLFIIETMADLAEAKAALLAVRENSDLPAFVTMTFAEDGRTFLGTTPEVAALTLSSLGADAVGINCSLGPADIAPLIKRMLPWTSCPVMVQANAGLPKMVEGRTVYAIGPQEYTAAVREMVEEGVTIVGGCCGTSPDYIRAEVAMLEGRRPASRCVRDDFACTSAQQLVSIARGEFGVIGERINPTGKPRMKEALRSGNHDYVMGEAIAQQRAGAQILDVNAGLPEIDERSTLVRLMGEIQEITTLPLQIDSSDPACIEAAARIYPGKPIINSCSGKTEQLDSVLAIVKRYGCAVVGLALDDSGIPRDAQGRLAIARTIVSHAEKLGIPRHDILIDCLAMAASTDQTAPRAILDAIRLIKRELPGVRCVLGVSNISFGLPCRDIVNATFLSAALGAGLDLAIVNPLSPALADAIAAWRVLSGEDESAQAYVHAYATRAAQKTPAEAPASQGSEPASEAGQAQDGRRASAVGQASGAPGAEPEPGDLARQAHDLVLEGRKGPMRDVVAELLSDRDPMDVINTILIPALDEVGDKFERGTFFLPQLMASAEAAKAGFSAIREASAAAGADALAPSKGTVAIATVRGDIHDIGKNIVRMLLENYGYEVIDLGRDVDPGLFAETVARRHVELAGLSALMTTTVKAMEQTIKLVRKQAPWCRIMVGGAVLNPEYAKMVGADYYAKDAATAARIAGEVFGTKGGAGSENGEAGRVGRSAEGSGGEQSS
jgi:5-methyltetrahydrofolate--homocysteine methyltransferase